MLLGHALKPDATVIELGGFKGRWTSDIFERCGCTIHVFEPVERYVETLRERFDGIGKIKIHDFAVGASNRSFTINLAGDGSSAFGSDGSTETAREVRFLDWYEASGIDRIDLMQINIEGGEYDLLEHLLDTGLIMKVDRLQVQFHDFIPNAMARMQHLRAGLAKTHRPTFHFPFIWDGWELSKGG